MQTFVKDESDEEEEDGGRKARQKESYRNATNSRRWSRERERARERESKREGGGEREVTLLVLHRSGRTLVQAMQKLKAQC